MEWLLLLLFFVTYLGLFAGAIISSKAKEELHQGRKYFLLLKHPLIIVILFSFFYSLKMGVMLAALATIIVSGISVFLMKKYAYYHHLFFLSFFAIALFETRSALVASCIFFYGMLTASIKYDIEASFFRNLRFLFEDSIVFLIVGSILILLF